eukprot:10600602-Prorocentrum_lima.AAC.1
MESHRVSPAAVFSTTPRRGGATAPLRTPSATSDSWTELYPQPVSSMSSLTPISDGDAAARIT